ncbi:sodium/potassium/calcium exchanger 5-like isoform X1 [Macrosteles quadrilineatus]|uniref:sodium/potassium/calcium exchanger 5-like isoform X1 n=2 Tax=Macrosteles quadrilineatus TaxID=74068 RepID=UPI0023E292BA|nr:sodium/potassium/calcium exchanger 5-like isoform X1 [Macrosteles quadrilineatus]
MTVRGIWFLPLAIFCLSLAQPAAAENQQNNSDYCIPKEESSDDFPADIFTMNQRKHGAIVIHVCVGLYFFIVIAFVCNDYFLPSVDCICQDLSLSQDVAGATFMALATCTPELFTNLIGTFLTESDLGVGTVVGSAVFNTLGVPACGGLAATTVIRLQVYPLARDCIIYSTVIGVLAVLLWDEKIYWYESVILIVLYFCYCVIMFCDGKITKAAKKVLRKTNSFDSSKTIKSDVSSGAGDGIYRPTYYHGEQLSSFQRARSASLKDSKNPMDAEKQTCHEEDEHKGNLRRISSLPSIRTVSTECISINSLRPFAISQSNGETTTYGTAETIRIPDDSSETALCIRPKGFWRSFWWFFTLPVEVVLWLTIPNCRNHRKLYPLTFIMCIVWIGISSYVVSWMMTIFGNTYNLSDSIMGITFLAIGGSMPEACSSVINARLGIGSMSISNALGANTLDILLCLGLPWMIKTLLPASWGGGPIKIQSPGLTYNTAAQIACVAILFVAAYLNKFHYNKILGSVCLVMYLSSIAFILVVETNVFHWTQGKVYCS